MQQRVNAQVGRWKYIWQKKVVMSQKHGTYSMAVYAQAYLFIAT